MTPDDAIELIERAKRAEHDPELRRLYGALGGDAADYEAWIRELPLLDRIFQVGGRSAPGEIGEAFVSADMADEAREYVLDAHEATPYVVTLNDVPVQHDIGAAFVGHPTSERNSNGVSFGLRALLGHRPWAHQMPITWRDPFPIKRDYLGAPIGFEAEERVAVPKIRPVTGNERWVWGLRLIRTQHTCGGLKAQSLSCNACARARRKRERETCTHCINHVSSVPNGQSTGFRCDICGKYVDCRNELGVAVKRPPILTEERLDKLRVQMAKFYWVERAFRVALACADSHSWISEIEPRSVAGAGVENPLCPQCGKFYSAFRRVSASRDRLAELKFMARLRQDPPWLIRVMVDASRRVKYLRPNLSAMRLDSITGPQMFGKVLFAPSLHARLPGPPDTLRSIMDSASRFVAVKK